MASWTAPRTWIALEVPSATTYNIHVRDNLIFLHDVLTGASDLGSDWAISTGRNLNLVDAANVNHGMTAFLQTNTYGFIGKRSSTLGGISIIGASEAANAYGAVLTGVVGNATPTFPAVAFIGAKKNGTSVQNLGGSEAVFQFVNNSVQIGQWYGDGLNVAGGMAVGFNGVPVPQYLKIGDADFSIGISGSVAQIIFSSTGAQITYSRTSFGMVITSDGELYLNSGTNIRFGVPLNSLGGGAAPTLGSIGGAGPTTAAQNSWQRFKDSTGAQFWMPAWK